MQRYFVNKEQINNNIVNIDINDSHHITNVMRMELNDQVTVCDNDKTYLCKIVSLGKHVKLEIIDNIIENPELSQNITIAQGIVRREKMEEVIRRLVELGCCSYIPVQMKKCAFKNKDINLERITKIIKEASEQSQRSRLMNMSNVISFKELIDSFKKYDLVLLAHAQERNNINFWSKINKQNYQNVLVIVGPESGFDSNEVQAMVDNGANIISLGKRVLRTETAPLYIMSILSFMGEQYEN